MPSGLKSIPSLYNSLMSEPTRTTAAERLELVKWMFESDDEDEVQRRVRQARAGMVLSDEEMREMELAILDETMERHRTLGAWAVGTQFYAREKW